MDRKFMVAITYALLTLGHLALADGGWIKGTVTDRDGVVGNARVFAFAAELPRVPPVNANANGMYSFNGNLVLDRQYELCADDPRRREHGYSSCHSESAGSETTCDVFLDIMGPCPFGN
jgi:hypothetical protein